MAKKLNQVTSLPQMVSAFSGWEQNITFIRITQNNVDGDIIDVDQSFSLMATVQPLQPEAIQLKPEGQRSFEWLQIHARRGSPVLVTNDRFEYNGVRFKIMADNNYNSYNYCEYHAIRDTQQ